MQRWRLGNVIICGIPFLFVKGINHLIHFNPFEVNKF